MVQQRVRIGRALGAALCLGLLCTGCAWLGLDDDAAQQARMASKEEVAGCTEIGRSVTKTRAKRKYKSRSQEQIASELETLARNAAPGLGADTVVVDGPIELEGVNAKRRFALYRCGDVGD
jgi:hypothetical protein